MLSPGSIRRKEKKRHSTIPSTIRSNYVLLHDTTALSVEHTTYTPPTRPPTRHLFLPMSMKPTVAADGTYTSIGVTSTANFNLQCDTRSSCARSAAALQTRVSRNLQVRWRSCLWTRSSVLRRRALSRVPHVWGDKNCFRLRARIFSGFHRGDSCDKRNEKRDLKRGGRYLQSKTHGRKYALPWRLTSKYINIYM